SAAVVVLLSEEGDRFRVDVTDDVGRDSAESSDSGEGVPDADMGLAVLTGLVDDLDIVTSAGGGTVPMSWPVGAVSLGLSSLLPCRAPSFPEAPPQTSPEHATRPRPLSAPSDEASVTLRDLRSDSTPALRPDPIRCHEPARSGPTLATCVDS